MKSKKKYPPILPLEFLRKVSDFLPGIWDEIEEARNIKGEAEHLEWPEWCYFPMCLTDVLLRERWMIPGRLSEPIRAEKREMMCGYICALAPWRRSKEIYVMSEELENLLYEQDDAEIPSEVLLKMPYQCFYVKTNNLYFEKDKADGFFAFLDYDTFTHNSSLEFLFVMENGKIEGLNIRIDQNNIEDSLRKSVDDLKKSKSKLLEDERLQKILDNDFFINGFIDYVRKPLTNALQLVLYILAENADIKEHEERAPRRSQDTIRDTYKEIHKWDVGVKIAQSIRKNSVRREDGGDKSDKEAKLIARSHKRPHMRRGHWHHYWTGPRKGERKIILRWIPPTFIGSRSEDIPVTLHHVTKNEGE